MRAWLMDSFEGIEKLRLGEVADPQPGPGQALLRVQFRGPESGRRVPGPGDVSGQTAAAAHPGPRRRRRRAGRRRGRERRARRRHRRRPAWRHRRRMPGAPWPRRSLCPPPTSFRFREAGRWKSLAGGPLVFLTAWQALTQWSDPPAAAPPGSMLLVTGASGGVGTAAVLLGKSMNLIVVALSRSAAKRRRS